MMNNYIKKSKGITLISLVITIIVLLIITGITMNFFAGENGMINRANSAKISTEKAEILEQLKLAMTEINFQYLSNGKQKTLTSYFTDYNNYKDYTVFVNNSSFDISAYPIENYEVAGSNLNKYLDISIEKNKGTGKLHRFIIKLGQDNNAQNGEFAEGVEETLEMMQLGEVSEVENNIKILAINYHLDGGTLPQDAKTSYIKGRIQIYPIPIKEGYIFDGWYENSSFSGSKVTSTNENYDRDINIYAKWIGEADSDYFTWAFGDNVATITGLSTAGVTAYNSGELSILVIPTKYNGTTYPGNVGQTVTQIGNSAFKDKTSIRKVVIGDQIISLGQHAFDGCTGIIELEVPISTNIVNNTSGHATFIRCTNISIIKLTKGTGEGIDYDTSTIRYTPWYMSNNDVTIIMDDNITKIGKYMFFECTKLKQINFPNKLESIGEYAFQNCSALNKIIEFPDTLKTIGEYAFDNCSNITGTLRFPRNISTIEKYTFRKCTGITKVIIGDEIASLGEHAFDGCTGITELEVPISTNIVNNTSGHATFIRCTNISTIKLTKGTGEGIDYDTSTIKYTPWYMSNNDAIIIMDDNITKIGKYMFYECTKLKQINFPNKLESIGDYAFQNCTALNKTIEFPDTLKTIGEYAFDNCSNITGTLNFPSNVSTIEKYTFRKCTKITKVIIEDTITSLGEHAFDGCTGITELEVPISTNIVNNTSGHATFIRCTNISIIKLTKGTRDGIDYTTSTIKYTPWYLSRANLQKVILEKGITSIGNYTFNGLNNTTSFYYTGTDVEWVELQNHIGSNNAPLTNATVTCNYSE